MGAHNVPLSINFRLNGCSKNWNEEGQEWEVKMVLIQNPLGTIWNSSPRSTVGQ